MFGSVRGGAGRGTRSSPPPPRTQTGKRAFVTDSNRPQPLLQPPPTACPTASGNPPPRWYCTTGVSCPALCWSGGGGGGMGGFFLSVYFFSRRRPWQCHCPTAAVGDPPPQRRLLGPGSTLKGSLPPPGALTGVGGGGRGESPPKPRGQPPAPDVSQSPDPTALTPAREAGTGTLGQCSRPLATSPNLRTDYARKAVGQARLERKWRFHT